MYRDLIHKGKSYKKTIKNISIFLSVSAIILIAGFYLVKAVAIINEYGFRNLLKMYDEKAKLIYFLICFMQPIILPLPEPVTIMGGSTVFGPLKAASIGFCGTILGIIVMFSFAKFAGVRIVRKVIDDKKLEKFNCYIEKNETLIILMLFILPILPDEVICMGSGLAQINSGKFICVAAISKLITSISLSYSLKLIEFSWSFAIIAIVVIGVLLIKRNKSYVK